MKLFTLTLLFTSLVYAHDHREHGAHVHGAGQLGIAFEGAKGKIDFDIPSESIIGFEYEANNDKDKKKQADALGLLETKISSMLVFDAALKCQITKDEIKVNIEKEEHEEKDAKHKGHEHKGHKHISHSEVEAVFNVACEKSPAGTDLTVNFHSQFKKIKKIEVQLVVDTLQKAETVTKANTKITLK